MEFDFDINSLLRDVITTVDSRLQVCRNAAGSYPDARLRLFDIVNKMGEASAKAQGLAGAITTGRRLETSDHHLYVIKDPKGSRSKGAVVGVLKMGRKRLFVYDRHGQQWEMNPLCVLDFYVHESRQRMGCGRRLFDFMLKMECLCPQHLAVDRPSHKFSSFLAKHYGLKTEIPQVNNFVIFEGFFTKRPDGDFVQNRRSANQAKPADYSRQDSNPASWQNGLNYNNGISSQGRHAGTTPHPPTPPPPRGPGGRPPSGRPPSGSHAKMVAAGLPSNLHNNSLKDLNLNPRSAHALNSSGTTSPRGPSDAELRSVSAGSSGHHGGGGPNNLQLLQSTMYSRHQPLTHPPPPLAASSSSSAPRPYYTTTAHRPPTTEKTPPLLTRDGAPKDYLESLNLHHNYQGRAGHLLVPPDPRGQRFQPGAPAYTTTPAVTTTTTAGSVSSGSQLANGVPSVNTNGRGAYSQRGAGAGGGGYYTNPSLHGDSDTWTVFGAIRNHNYNSARHTGRTRLW
ncbi:hypothetical protein ACOMHN_050181 [Nucella lapillus]